ncbi:MAG: four helix bundle protein [Bacteroidia bacterium]|nr:four helix bundle protein [Bacteroidia bacterium]
MGKINSYKDLIAWQKSIALVSDIYKLTSALPASEKFGMASQLQRAAVSVPSNIAEGWGRESTKNYIQFLRISRGSLLEIETLLTIAHNLSYLTEEENEKICMQVEEVLKVINGLIKSLEIKVLTE